MVVRIGTERLELRPLASVLYPHQLPPCKELGRYIQHYQTVEVNSTYYRRD